jgi:hypothetical protein
MREVAKWSAMMTVLIVVERVSVCTIFGVSISRFGMKGVRAFGW